MAKSVWPITTARKVGGAKGLILANQANKALGAPIGKAVGDKESLKINFKASWV